MRADRFALATHLQVEPAVAKGACLMFVGSRSLVIAAGFAAAATLAGCAGTPATQDAFTPERALVLPIYYARPDSHGCSGGLFSVSIVPRKATIYLNQQIQLRAKGTFFYGGGYCSKPVAAVWRSNGGSLQVIHGGKAARFSASAIGKYDVYAVYERHVGMATVAVVSM